MSLVKNIFELIFSHTKDMHSKDKINLDYYNLSPTCQIPNLPKIYEQYFGKINDGTFVEFGAFDGEYVSNSSGLADIGWTGYYIEPIPLYNENCKNRHAGNKNITVSNYAIGEYNGKIEINVAGPLSTASNDMKNNFKNLQWASSSFQNNVTEIATMITLEDYLNKENISPFFELLIIDVEGYEWNALKNFKIREWMPQMVIIELHDQNDDYIAIREECNNIVKYFDYNGYKVIYKDFSNTIYVPKDRFPL